MQNQGKLQCATTMVLLRWGKLNLLQIPYQSVDELVD